MNYRIPFAASNLALAVMLGALGAHLLKDELTPESLKSFETGVRYHLFHGLGLMVLLCLPLPKERLKYPWLMMAVGMIMFCFSIYGLSSRALFGLEGGLQWLGPITPLGGLLLISSWLWIAIIAFATLRGIKS